MKRIITNFIFLVILQAGNLSAQQWMLIGEMPHPVAGGAAVVHDSKIFILGGYSDFTQNPVDLIQMFDPVTGDWSLVGNMQEARYGLSAGLINDNIFYFGGIRDSSDFLISLEAFGPIDEPDNVNTLTEHDSFNRFFATSVVDGTSLYIFGGEPYFEADSVELPYVSIFNLISFEIDQELDTLFSTTEPAHHQMAAKVGDKVYIFGGVSHSIENRIYNFDIPSRSFVRASFDMIIPRAAGSAVYLPSENQIYLIGGLNELEPALGDVEIYDPFSENSFVGQVGNLIVPRSEQMAVAFDGVIYVFGGKDDQGNVVSIVEKFDPKVTTSSEELNTPLSFNLEQNYPNPFNPVTNIKFSLPKQSVIKLIIYNSLGEEISILADGLMEAGVHNLQWDGNNDSGLKVPSGIYFYKLLSQSSSVVKKMTLLK